MIEAVRRDLERGLKNPATGRNGLTPSQVLRSFVLKSVKNWDYRELRERIADGYTLRQFTEFYCQPVPKHHAFNSAFHRLTPETVKAINELVWRRRWISAWKMATHSGWTALSCRRTFITRPTTPCYGMSYAWSLVWSAASKKQSRSGFGVPQSQA